MQFSEYVKAGATSEFIDCTVWVADWILLTTGLDPMANWRGRYKNRFGYMRLLLREENGLYGATCRGIASIGGREIDPSEATQGDVGLIKIMTVSRTVEDALGLRGRHTWWLKAPGGMLRCPAAIAAWRI